MLLHLLASSLLGLPPLLTSDLFLLHSARDEFILEIVALVIELRVVLGDVILIVQQHLVVLCLFDGYVLVSEVFHLIRLFAVIGSIVVDLPLLYVSLLLHPFLLILLPHQLVQLLLVHVLEHDVVAIPGAGLFLTRVARLEAAW